MVESADTAASLRWAVSRLATRLRAEQPGSDALTRLAASVLANLRHAGPTTVTRLAEIEGLQPQSLTRTLQALEHEGRVGRERDESDGRAQRISLTDAGRDALDDHVLEGNRWLARTMDGVLTSAERQVLAIAADLIMTVATREDGPVRARTTVSRDLPAAPL